MTVIGISQLSKSFGTQILFNNLSFAISQGEKIGLVGPNGSGKSTLLKCIAGLDDPDSGMITKRVKMQIGYAGQSVDFPSTSIENVLIEKTKPGDFTAHTKGQILLGKAQFTDFSQDAQTLSGGWKKRLDIVRACMLEPDLLLLDEPTNHLDLESIVWLEKFLQKEISTFLLVSHDRYFLENVCTKIIELNRAYEKGVFLSEGPYSQFLERKSAYLEAQQNYEKSLKSKVSDEVEWLKKSPKARTTKSTARVQKTYALLDELEAVKKRNTKKTVDIKFSESEKETKKLLVAKNLSKSYGEKILFTKVDLTLSPRSCLAIMGENGTGKTTLLKILANKVSADMGTIKYADGLRLVYFDQHRKELSDTCTLKDALSANGDFVIYRGEQIHVHGWAQKFLFQKERLQLPVKYLSGGERARILLAKLMLEPADILFLDEPTNDLDIETLEVIEESLKEFQGATVLISHDRCLVDRISTQILSLSKNGAEFFSDYTKFKEASSIVEEIKADKQIRKQSKTQDQKKLSYNEQRELDAIECVIFDQEKLVASLEEKLSFSVNDASLYQSFADAQKKLDMLFERWQELLNKSG